MSRLTGPAWDSCDVLELDDVPTADGVNMILYTLAEAFHGEYDVDGSHTAYALQAKEALIGQEEDIDLETALAALELESDTDLEGTDVQEIPLAYKKPRQLRGEWDEWNSWPSCNVMFRDGEEAKTSFFVFGRDHSMSDYIGKGVIDTGCSRFLVGQKTRKMGNRCFHEDEA